jgi:hypothetical protein
MAAVARPFTARKGGRRAHAKTQRALQLTRTRCSHAVEVPRFQPNLDGRYAILDELLARKPLRLCAFARARSFRRTPASIDRWIRPPICGLTTTRQGSRKGAKAQRGLHLTRDRYTHASTFPTIRDAGNAFLLISGQENFAPWRERVPCGCRSIHGPDDQEGLTPRRKGAKCAPPSMHARVILPNHSRRGRFRP